MASTTTSALEPAPASSPAVKISLPLPYQQELFTSLLTSDALLILARGLGLLRIVTNLLHAYDVAGENLVLLVNASEDETDWVGEAMAETGGVGCAKGLRVINTEAMGVAGRRKTYERGGVMAVTSRILVVDLLTDNIPSDRITGVVVLHADRVTATSLEAFILRVYRRKNKSGFIKAFSDNPSGFASGFSPLSTMLKNLHLRTPTLYPRFHVAVAESLESKTAEVIELDVPLSPAMLDIQNAILQCIESSLSELRKGGNSREIDMEDWNVEAALHRAFDVTLRRQLDPVWHRVSWKTRQIVGDLKELRDMLSYLVTYDAVSFHQYLEGILATQSSGATSMGMGRMNQSPWLYLDAAQTIFETAKRRAYVGTLPKNGGSGATIPATLHPVLEELPKWATLSGILDEIEREAVMNPQLDHGTNGTVLVMCSDAKECRQLREYLQTVNRPVEDEEDGEDDAEDDDGEEKEGGRVTHSANYMMRRRLRGYLAWKQDLSKFKAAYNEMNRGTGGGGTGGAQMQKRMQEPQSFRGRAPANKRRRMRGSGNVGSSSKATAGAQPSDEQAVNVAALWQSLQPTEEEAAAKQEIAVDPLEHMEDFYELFELKNLVVVHPFSGDMDDRLLEELRPRWIVMYNPDTAFVRRVEVYRSSHNDRQVKVYFLYYGDSVEEQRFLSAVRREKDAFSKLIKEKGSMAVTLTTDAHTDIDQAELLRTITNTRLGGGGKLSATAEPPRVIVDIREFRSSLPSLLDARGTSPVPVTLTVGDYILTPTICVERKSIKDLIASFRNGRLYTQCEAMSASYAQPMVLIEFEKDQSFSLEPFAGADTSSSSTAAPGGDDIQAKLVLLTIAFPRMSFIWSSSPHQTAEIFAELKSGHPEPDVDAAVVVGLEAGEDPNSSYNNAPQEMLRVIPGISGKNARLVMQDVENLTELSNMDEADIAKLVGKEAAKKVWRFFNKTF